MRQTFDIKGGPQDGRAHLPLVREQLSAQGLDGLYVPHDDEYQNEYLPDANERLAWVSGFTGSFGSAFVFTDRAVIFADGSLYMRYANGVVALVDASPEGFRLRGTFRLPAAGNDSWSHPALANGRLYLRENDSLHVYDVRAAR